MMRPAAISALMSRSESNMAGPYRGRRLARLAALDLQPVITDGDDHPITDPDHFAGFASCRQPVRGGDRRAVGGSAIYDVHATSVHTHRQMGLRYGARLVGDLDQLRILLARPRLRVAA